MQITFGLIIKDERTILKASARLIARPSETCRMSISSTLFATPSAFCYGRASLPALGSLGGEASALKGYGVGSASIASLRSSGEGGFYIPPEPVTGWANLRPLYSSGLIRTSVGATGSANLPAIKAKGGDVHYGEGAASLPAIRAFGAEGPPKHTAYLVSQMFTISAAGSFKDHIVVLNSSGQIVDTITCTRIAIAEILDSMTASGDFTLIGEFLVSMEDGMTLFHSLDGQSSTAALNSASRVWVVNMENGASGQYDNYGFNSFFESDGKYYGVADDGIYELDGDDDNGAEILALIQAGKSDLGTPRQKRIENVYAGVSSEGKLLLKVEADGQSYTYEARSSSETLENHRFDVGKGLRGNYYDFTLLNQNGDDFDLESISFEPVVLSRKI